MENHVGKNIKKTRIKYHISQEKLADGICSRQYISLIENGKQEPTAQNLIDITTCINYINKQAGKKTAITVEDLIKTDLEKAEDKLKELNSKLHFTDLNFDSYIKEINNIFMKYTEINFNLKIEINKNIYKQFYNACNFKNGDLYIIKSFIYNLSDNHLFLEFIYDFQKSCGSQFKYEIPVTLGLATIEVIKEKKIESIYNDKIYYNTCVALVELNRYKDAYNLLCELEKIVKNEKIKFLIDIEKAECCIQLNYLKESELLLNNVLKNKQITINYMQIAYNSLTEIEIKVNDKQKAINYLNLSYQLLNQHFDTINAYYYCVNSLKLNHFDINFIKLTLNKLAKENNIPFFNNLLLLVHTNLELIKHITSNINKSFLKNTIICCILSDIALEKQDFNYLQLRKEIKYSEEV